MNDTEQFVTWLVLAAIAVVIWKVIPLRVKGAIVLCVSLTAAAGLYGIALANGYGTGTGVRAHSKTTQLAKKDIPKRYLVLYQRAPKCKGLAWYELAAIGKAESDHGRLKLPGVRSGSNHAGAAGPMQFIRPTWQRWGRGGNVYNPAHAIPASARFLCSIGAGRNFTLGAAAYNAGPGAVQRYGGVPPYRETRIYVAKVNAWADAYRTGRFS